MNLEAVLLPAAVFLAVHAVLAGFFWLRIVMAERPGRRRGMTLNLARRAGPPVIAGIAVYVLGSALNAETGLPAAILAAGGLSYGLHRGLTETRQADWRSVGLRIAVSLGLALGALWLWGLAQGGGVG
jgi:uncharacterized protein YfiM (DUF2279 family)